MTAFVITVVSFLIQQLRVLSFFGINPNLVFITLLFFSFRGGRFRFLLVLFAAVIALAAVFYPTWIIPFAVLIFTVALLGFLKNFMTGSRLLDFLAAVFLGTFVFYFFNGLFDFQAPFNLIFKEAVYNTIVGTVLWLVISEKNAQS